MTQVESGEAPPVSAYDFTVKDIKVYSKDCSILCYT